MTRHGLTKGVRIGNWGAGALGIPVALSRRALVQALGSAVIVGLGGCGAPPAPTSPVNRLKHRFTRAPDGVPSRAETGQLFDLYGTPTGEPNVKPIVSGGALVQPYSGSGVAAYYLQHDHGAPVKRIGATWRFSRGSLTDHGVMAVIAWGANYAKTAPTIPDSSCHITISKTVWNYGVIVDGILIDIAGGYLGSPLRDDGSTVHSIEAELNAAAGGAQVHLPDGRIVSVLDPRIEAGNSDWAVWEGYRMAGSDPSVQILEIWSEA